MDGQVLIMNYSTYERERIKQILLKSRNFLITEIMSYTQFEAYTAPMHALSLILLDLSFPSEVEGLHVLQKLRAHPDTANTPIIIISKQDVHEYKVKASKLGVKDFIIKPFSVQRFEDSIASILVPTPSFSYPTHNIQGISMTFDEYIKREIMLCDRMETSLSMIVITPVSYNSLMDKYPSFDATSLETLRQNIATKFKYLFRKTDTVFINHEKDILVLLSATDAQGVKTVCTKLDTLLGHAIDIKQIQYSDIFYYTTVTYPEDGRTFLELMEVAQKKINQKEILDLMTAIPSNTRSYADKSYQKFNRWF